MRYNPATARKIFQRKLEDTYNELVEDGHSEYDSARLAQEAAAEEVQCYGDHIHDQQQDR